MERMRRIAVWWSIPCKAISGIFRELAEREEYAVDIFLLKDMSEERKKLGWTFPNFGKAKVQVLPQGQEEKHRVIEEIITRPYDLHIINGSYAYPENAYIVAGILRAGKPYGIFTEAPYNEFSGLKRWLKYLYLAGMVPLKSRMYAKSARFVCCLSGGGAQALGWLRWFGYPKERLYPFGYFSEPPAGTAGSKTGATSRLKALCTGYLTRNKGQRLLLDALAMRPALAQGISVTITGYGPEKESLEAMITQHQLQDAVSLAGVVDEKTVDELYLTSDIFIAPGIEEPWGIRINDAILAGLPIVGSDRIGAMELVAAGGGGVSFKSGSAEALAEVLTDLVEHREKVARYREHQEAYRWRIHPKTAADHLDDIIQYAVDGVGVRPGLPPWLEKQ